MAHMILSHMEGDGPMESNTFEVEMGVKEEIPLIIQIVHDLKHKNPQN